MKEILFIMIMFFHTSGLGVFCQTSNRIDIPSKEKLEMAYIVNCLIANKDVDSLIHWTLSSKYQNTISYKFKAGRLAFFTLAKDSTGVILQSIEYYHHSFQKIIFKDDAETNYVIGSNTRFDVWMSRDKLRVYFCIIDEEYIQIWVLKSGNSIFSSKFDLP